MFQAKRYNEIISQILLCESPKNANGWPIKSEIRYPIQRNSGGTVTECSKSLI